MIAKIKLSGGRILEQESYIDSIHHHTSLHFPKASSFDIFLQIFTNRINFFPVFPFYRFLKRSSANPHFEKTSLDSKFLAISLSIFSYPFRVLGINIFWKNLSPNSINATVWAGILLNFLKKKIGFGLGIFAKKKQISVLAKTYSSLSRVIPLKIPKPKNICIHRSGTDLSRIN